MITVVKAASLRSVALEHLPHVVTSRAVMSHAASAAWCTERFGAMAITPEIRTRETGGEIVGYLFDTDALWARRFYIYFFRQPDHAFEFKMTWG